MDLRQGLIAQLGKVMQMSYVPRDYNAALRFWIETMGVGPFFVNEHVKLQDIKYRGQPTEPDFGMALAYWGDVQVELIQQHNDAPSIYKEWIDEGHEGVNHLCILVDDMVHAREVCAEAGAEVLQEARLAGGREVIYVDTGGGPGTILEILQVGGGAFERLHEAARNWDGTDPIRPM